MPRGHVYELDCAICNCYHTEKIFFNGAWHDWKKPSERLVEQRKSQKRSRRKSPW